MSDKVEVSLKDGEITLTVETYYPAAENAEVVLTVDEAQKLMAELEAVIR